MFQQARKTLRPEQVTTEKWGMLARWDRLLRMSEQKENKANAFLRDFILGVSKLWAEQLHILRTTADGIR